MVAHHRPVGVVERHRSPRPRRTRLDHRDRVCFRVAASRRCSCAANCDRDDPNRGLPRGTIHFAVPAQRCCRTIPAVEDRDRAGDRGGFCRADRSQQDDRAHADDCVSVSRSNSFWLKLPNVEVSQVEAVSGMATSDHQPLPGDRPMFLGNRPGLDMAGLNPIALSASIWRTDSGPL